MSRVIGRYELLRPLARGGMAEVYLARRRAAGVEKLLVVKRIRAERAADPRFLDLFMREARLSMSLAHQNIVPVFDFGRTGDQVFLAMERIEGKDLGSSLARAGRDRALPPLLAAFVTAECCQALDYAHHRRTAEGAALGIIHRDVTPRNVLLSWSGEVKLTDFGIAALAGEDSSRLLGTPAFMAPEQARGEPLDVRADVYAMGLVLREALTARHARPGGSDRDAVLAAARSGELEPWASPGEPPNDVPEELAAIVERATAADRDSRYGDIRSMLEALDTFIVTERAANKGDAPARRLAAWLDRIWEGARDEPLADGLTGDPDGDLVSFLDDGRDEIGTGTEHSIAATVVDSASSDPTPSGAHPERVDASAPITPPSRRRLDRRWIVVPLAAAAVIAVGAGLSRSQEASDHVAPAPVLAIERPTPRIVERPPAQAPRHAPEPPASDLPAPPATPVARAHRAVDGQSSQPRNDRPSPQLPVDRTGGPLAPAPPQATDIPPASAATTRRVTIGAKPWAHFTVDGDPRQHETPQVLDLAPGPHRIHFANPQLSVERDVTIVVPADRDSRHIEDLRQ